MYRYSAIKAPVDKFDFVLDTMDEYGDKAMKKLGDMVKKSISYADNSIIEIRSNLQTDAVSMIFFIALMNLENLNCKYRRAFKMIYS